MDDFLENPTNEQEDIAKLDEKVDEIFKKHTDDDAIAEDKSADIESGEVVEKETAEPVAPVVEDVPVPDAFKDLPQWAELPKEVKDKVIAQEAQYKQQVDELSGFQQSWKPVADIAEQYRPLLAMEGKTVEQGMLQLLEVNNFARSGEPLDYINWYCQQRGVDFIDLVAQQVQAQEQVDPVVYGLQQKINHLESQLGGFNAQFQSQQLQQVDQVIADFAKDRPNFKAVEQDMAFFISNKRAKNLDEAYSLACRLNNLDANPVSQQPQMQAPVQGVAQQGVPAQRKPSNISLAGNHASGQPKASVSEKIDDVFQKFGIN
jgi:hypothetical protein